MSLETVRSVFEPVIRRVMHVYWRFARGMTLGVRALVIDEKRGRVPGQAQLCERLAPAGRRRRSRRDVARRAHSRVARGGQYRADRAA